MWSNWLCIHYFSERQIPPGESHYMEGVTQCVDKGERKCPLGWKCWLCAVKQLVNMAQYGPEVQSQVALHLPLGCQAQ